MAQTFRTDPETGRTVISQDNVVGRQMAGGERIDNRISDGGATVNGRDTVRRGYESMSAPTRPGTGYMARSEFESLSGMTETNPYGNDGFFSRVFGIDPSKIDYTNTLGTQGIANVKRMAYDRFMNPFAQVDVFGNPTMGASAARGTTRSGVQPGDLTIFGPAAEGQAEGIGALIGNALGFNMNPTIIPGTVGSDARGQDRGIYDFDVPKNMDELVSAALRENAIEARDPAAVPETIDRGIFTTDDDSPSGAVDYATVSQFPPAESTYDLEARLDRRRAYTPTVAEILLNDEPTYTGPFTSQTAEDIYMSGADTPVSTFTGGIGTDDTGGATITRQDGSDDVRYLADDKGPSAVYPYPERDLPFNRFGTPTSRPAPAATSTAPIDLTAGVGEELLGTRPTVPIDRSDDSGFTSVFQSTFEPTDVATRFTPEQVLRANQNNATMRRRAELMAQGMSVDAARMQAERESLRARAAALGFGQ